MWEGRGAECRRRDWPGVGRKSWAGAWARLPAKDTFSLQSYFGTRLSKYSLDMWKNVLLVLFKFFRAFNDKSSSTPFSDNIQ